MTVVPGTRLSPSQEKVLLLIRRGDMSYDQIGRELNLSRHTVATHAKRAFKRLGVCGRVGYLVSLVAEPVP